MGEARSKIGIISCSGEDCLGGTISRQAARKMLEEIRPHETVTICLPLFLAGGEEERAFAKDYPTISVDGCSKLCAKRGTEKYSGEVSGAINVSEIIGEDAARSGPLSTRNLREVHWDMIQLVSDAIAAEYDKVLKEAGLDISAATEKKPDGGCGCGGGCNCK